MTNEISYLNYNDFRDQVRTGDLIFLKGNYWISKFIRWWTKSEWNHVGILVWWDDADRLMVFESKEPWGVRFWPVSKYVAEYDGTIMVARLTVELRPGVPVAMKIGQYFDLVFQPYDWGEIFLVAFRSITHIKLFHHDSDYICSNFVKRILEALGVFMNADWNGNFTPETIASNPFVKEVCRLKTYKGFMHE